MLKYSVPLCVSENDPVCSSTALQGTVIGVLFEKTGEDIKGAVDSRVDLIDSEVSCYKDDLLSLKKATEKCGKRLNSLSNKRH